VAQEILERETVESASAATEVFVHPPELVTSRQGTPFPREARIEISQARAAYTPVEARELAMRLHVAADQAERADELLLRGLQEHCEKLHRFYEEADA
jgi:hypothetical protein